MSLFSPGVGDMRTLLTLLAIGLCSVPVIAVRTATAQTATQFGPMATPLDPSQPVPVQLPSNSAYEQLRLPLPTAPEQAAPYSPVCVVQPACEEWTPFDPVYANGAWTVGVSVVPTEMNMTRGKFGTWDDDHGTAVRWVIGWEGPEGGGIRGRGWGFGLESDTPSADDVELTAGMFSLDLYKRLRGRQGELLLGVGTAGGQLEFHVPDYTNTRFEGGGLGAFAEGRFPIHQFERGDLGVIGRGRYTVLRGDWHDKNVVLMPPTNHEMLSVFEAAVGLEYRHLFGRGDDHYWYVSLSSEIQQWQSPMMDQFLYSSIGFTGVGVDLGMVW